MPSPPHAKGKSLSLHRRNQQPLTTTTIHTTSTSTALSGALVFHIPGECIPSRVGECAPALLFLQSCPISSLGPGPHLTPQLWRSRIASLYVVLGMTDELLLTVGHSEVQTHHRPPPLSPSRPPGCRSRPDTTHPAARPSAPYRTLQPIDEAQWMNRIRMTSYTPLPS